jgi:hypothetical protein
VPLGRFRRAMAGRAALSSTVLEDDLRNKPARLHELAQRSSDIDGNRSLEATFTGKVARTVAGVCRLGKLARARFGSRAGPVGCAPPRYGGPSHAFAGQPTDPRARRPAPANAAREAGAVDRVTARQSRRKPAAVARMDEFRVNLQPPHQVTVCVVDGWSTQDYEMVHPRSGLGYGVLHSRRAWLRVPMPPPC